MFLKEKYSILFAKESSYLTWYVSTRLYVQSKTRVLMWLLFGTVRLRQAEAQRTLSKEVAMATSVSQICTRLKMKHQRGIKRTRFRSRYV